MMTAKNGLHIYAVAIKEDGKIVSTDTHTYHDQEADEVSGVVAGQVSIDTTPYQFCPSRPPVTDEEWAALDRLEDYLRTEGVEI